MESSFDIGSFMSGLCIGEALAFAAAKATLLLRNYEHQESLRYRQHREHQPNHQCFIIPERPTIGDSIDTALCANQPKREQLQL
jgi:hypothetical protein